MDATSGTSNAFATKAMFPTNKKGRGETAPTFLIIAYPPVPVHPWSKVSKRWQRLRAANSPALISNADHSHIGSHCVQNKFAGDQALYAAKLNGRDRGARSVERTSARPEAAGKELRDRRRL